MLHKHHAHASTDITGFGLLGHADNLSKAQQRKLRFVIDTLPIIDYMDEVARAMVDKNGFNLFNGTSAETSGGLLVALSKHDAEAFMAEIEQLDGFPAWIIGRVENSEGYESHAVIEEGYKVIPVPSRIHSS